MFKLRRFLKPYAFQTIIGSIAKLLEAILELFLPLIMAKIIDIGIPNTDNSYIIKMTILMLIVSIVGFAFALVSQYYASITSQGVGAKIRDALIRKISTFSYKEIDKFGASTFVNRITSDTNQIVIAIAFLIRLVSRAPFLCIGSLIMAIYIDPVLSIIFAVLIPIFIIILYVFMSKSVPIYNTLQKKLDRFTQVLRENLSGIRVIRAFARHKGEKTRVYDSTDDLSKTYIRVNNMTALMNPITSLIMNLGIVALFYFGGIRVDHGYLSQGSILALVNYVTQILLSLIIVANLVVMFTKASASASRINEVLKTIPSVNDPEKPIDNIINGSPMVQFKNVSFGYGQNKKTLENISFSIKKGEVLGIIGTTGSGKTSLINLIPRFYDVTAGEVLVGGVNVKNLSQHYLRTMIGIVPQKSILFKGTIADNIRWGNINATDDDVVWALKIAKCYMFVKELEKGINSPIFEGGKNFSGGQKQRLAIARAIIKKPEIIILDDSLSALDYATDLNLRQSLRQSLNQQTVIIISQRVSSVADADKILVLDDGLVQGLGTHNELIQSCETYRDIYTSQTREKEGDKGA